MVAIARRRFEATTTDGCTFQPHITEVPGVQSRLKVASEPGSYLARVRQHMKLKEQLTACVRELVRIHGGEMPLPVATQKALDSAAWS